MMSRLALWASVALAPCLATAGDFDCSVVYDEFDQLMMAQFLVRPDTYVETLDSFLTRTDFLQLQQNSFKLRDDRQGAGIAIFRTGQNIHGKLIYSWQDHPAETQPPFVADEIVVFGRVADGYAPQRIKPIYLTVGFAADLDTGDVLDLDDPNADITYDLVEGEFVIEAVDPALIFFPIESLCSSVQ